MRRLFLLLTLVLIALIAVYRDRLYLRDPLGSLTRDGTPQPDARVFINFENDVLVQEHLAIQEHGGAEMFAVQHWNQLEAVPANLTCIEGLLCLAPADRLIDTAGTTLTRKPAEMTDRAVHFIDDNGHTVQVTIR